MRYTVYGFSQSEAIKLRRTEIVNGKKRKVAIDHVDLLILRWLVDFWPKMKKVEIGGEEYGWVKYDAFLDDYPIVDIKKRMLMNRFKKLVDFGILTHKTVRNNDGTFSYYGFGPNYMALIDDSHAIQDDHLDDTIQPVDTTMQNIDEGYAINCNTVCNDLTTPMQQIDEQINLSIKDPSTNNPSTSNQLQPVTPLASNLFIPGGKKESDGGERQTFNQIIDDFTDDENLRESLRGYVQYKVSSCSKSGKVFTNRALELSLKTLCGMSCDPSEMARIADMAVEHSWSGFFDSNGKKKSNLDETDYEWMRTHGW